MELFKSMEISASGLQAQRVMVNAISTNLANVHTTRTDGGRSLPQETGNFFLVPAPPEFSGTSVLPDGSAADGCQG